MAASAQSRNKQRLDTFASFAPGIAALVFSIVALMLPMLHARAADTDTSTDIPPRQVISLGQSAPYRFAVYANQALDQASLPVTRVVLIVHGVKRNADDYYAVGAQLLKSVGYSAADTLLLAPNFMTRADPGPDQGMPLWGGGTWMQGEPSEAGVEGMLPFQALDDLLRYLADRQHFPKLKQVVLIGHSAGAQLMQRYAVMNAMDDVAAQAGLTLRYVISSPSSYLYFEHSRPDGGSFKAVPTVMCPGYDNYRYGLVNAPDYLQRQGLNAQQVFARYAARDITYMVGARDDNPRHRFLDRACGAAMQGATRVERQLNFVRYERFLAAQWNIPVNHPEFEVKGAAHDAEKLFRSDQTARMVLGIN